MGSVQKYPLKIDWYLQYSNMQSTICFFYLMIIHSRQKYSFFANHYYFSANNRDLFERAYPPYGSQDGSQAQYQNIS